MRDIFLDLTLVEKVELDNNCFGFNLPPSLQKIATSSTKFW